MFSVIRYCLSVYGASTATQRKRLQKLVRFAARVVSGRKKFDHVSDVLTDHGWLHVDSMYSYHSLVLINKMLATSEPQQFADSLVTRQSVHMRATRNSGRFVTPTIRSESGRRRFLYSAVSEYNDLPPQLRDLNHYAFKSALRMYLFERERET